MEWISKHREGHRGKRKGDKYRSDVEVDWKKRRKKNHKKHRTVRNTSQKIKVKL